MFLLLGTLQYYYMIEGYHSQHLTIYHLWHLGTLEYYYMIEGYYSQHLTVLYIICIVSVLLNIACVTLLPFDPYLLEAETKWCRHFAYDNPFLPWRCLSFDEKFTEVCTLGFNWQYVNTGSDNGVLPIWRQANIWINHDQVHLCLLCTNQPQWVNV